jgi:hypothetical protein
MSAYASGPEDWRQTSSTRKVNLSIPFGSIIATECARPRFQFNHPFAIHRPKGFRARTNPYTIGLPYHQYHRSVGPCRELSRTATVH